jgi:hypothetical protein
MSATPLTAIPATRCGDSFVIAGWQAPWSAMTLTLEDGPVPGVAGTTRSFVAEPSATPCGDSRWVAVPKGDISHGQTRSNRNDDRCHGFDCVASPRTDHVHRAGSDAAAGYDIQSHDNDDDNNPPDQHDGDFVNLIGDKLSEVLHR